MNRQNVILALGLLLVLANGIASGEIQALWKSVTGLAGTGSSGPNLSYQNLEQNPSQNLNLNPNGTLNYQNPLKTAPSSAETSGVQI